YILKSMKPLMFDSPPFDKNDSFASSQSSYLVTLFCACWTVCSRCCQLSGLSVFSSLSEATLTMIPITVRQLGLFFSGPSFYISSPASTLILKAFVCYCLALQKSLTLPPQEEKVTLSVTSESLPVVMDNTIQYPQQLGPSRKLKIIIGKSLEPASSKMEMKENDKTWKKSPDSESSWTTDAEASSGNKFTIPKIKKTPEK
ncbi:hypothetical protein STEG23_014209, partial [Scotinomys teguina]